MKISSENTFFLIPTVPDEVEDIIKTLSIGKSLGLNSIPAKLLKQFSKSISISLSYLLNLHLNEDSVFANALKHASEISLFKNGDYL